MKDFLLEVKGLKKYFPVYGGLFRKQIGVIKSVDGVDFSIRKGEVVGIVGESGSGKSTLARASIRLIEPTAGTILFMGKSLLNLSDQELKSIRRHVQMVFQDPYSSLNPRKTIQESIGEGIFYHGLVKNLDEQREIVGQILSKVGLSSEDMDRYPHQFSGGQQQRICIGRAIALNPCLLICDEAVSALDVSIQAQILNLLIDLKQTMDLSYLFISHDLSVIRYLADRVLVLYLGKVVEEGLTEEVFSNPQHPYTRHLISAIPKWMPD
jgi:ABC-type oligopeptide transport system ATPase subunit